MRTKTLSRIYFITKSLLDFAKRNRAVDNFQSLNDLVRKRIRTKGRGIQRSTEQMSTGETWEHSNVTWIGQQEHHFLTLQADFQTLAGNPPFIETYYFENPRIVIITDEQARRDPKEVLDDLIEKNKTRQGFQDLAPSSGGWAIHCIITTYPSSISAPMGSLEGKP